MSTPPRQERADSRRKRLRLIEAAREAVAIHGLAVTAAEIADRAEVGVGTLYRRFGSKDALVKDILLDAIAEMQTVADASLADPDPWNGLASFLIALSRAQSANRGLAEFTASEASVFSDDVREHSVSLRCAIQDITARAHLAGMLRDDVTWRDIVVLSLASVSAGECLGVRAANDQWQRTVALLLEGLRTPGAQPLPGQSPTDVFSGLA
jgi:AcrR family transcriptional regulator